MPMTRTFSNLKTSLARHLETHTHKKAFEKELNEKIATDKTKEEIFNAMAHLSYFCLKSNLCLNQFENLMGTAGICGLELGDINHSKAFISKFMSLSNISLVNKTCEWAKKQDFLTVTLDIGTEY